MVYHEQRDLAVSVHGDAFTTSGLKCEFGVFEDQLEAKYELKKGGRLGPGARGCKDFTVVNIESFDGLRTAWSTKQIRGRRKSSWKV